MRIILHIYVCFIQTLERTSIAEFDGTSARVYLLGRTIEIEGENFMLFRRFCDDKIS